VSDSAPPAARLPFEAQLRTPLGRAKDLVRGLLSLTAAPLGTLARVATREPVVALTFDDGPDPAWTPQVLARLEAHGARGTFFMLGVRAEAHPELVARALAGGHAVANHSWDHPSFPRLTALARDWELSRCQAALAAAGDAASAARLFRPPFGEQSVRSLRAARRAGYTVVTWDVVAEDWRDDPPDLLQARVMRRLRRGSIVVFHDSLYLADEERYRDRTPLLQALDRLLGELAGTLRFVTVPELLRLGRPVWVHHYHRLTDAYHARLR
jgi:peptidoglycan/xylan/chitin deacetylase (PgdA/CDA1 family)